MTGQPVSFTATVSVTAPAVGTPTGTVGFTAAGNPIAGCTAVALAGATAVCATAFNAANGATQSIVATYSGDTNFLTSMSPACSQTVNKGATTTTVTSNNNPSVDRPVGHLHRPCRPPPAPPSARRAARWTSPATATRSAVRPSR